MTAWAWVAAGAAVGAAARFLIDKKVQGLWKSVFPWGTLTVNVLASLILGVVTAAADGATQQALGIGLCGALSTYSTFSYGSLRLAEDGFTFLAAANVLVTVTTCLGAVSIGFALGR
ncbi:fluoride efflux transporter FluC [Streptomyces sp. NPDC102487]|uniref:fluoride efflux transporter FluC n=1 Tax=Streptomyces sp. NPDC102487 TaxID=3366182 RepID=UPI0038221EE8